MDLTVTSVILIWKQYEVTWRLIQKKKKMLDIAFEFWVDLKTVVNSLSISTSRGNMRWLLIQKKKKLLDIDSMVTNCVDWLVSQVGVWWGWFLIKKIGVLLLLFVN